MTDAELIESLRLWNRDDAADRIEAMIAERDEALEWLSASQGYIADAVYALDKQEAAEAKLVKAVEALEFYASWENWMQDERGVSLVDQDEGEQARATLAEIKSHSDEFATQKGESHE